MNLSINLASKPFRNYIPLFLLLGTLLLLTLTFSAVNLWIYSDSFQKAGELENSMSSDVNLIANMEQEIARINDTLKMLDIGKMNKDVNFINSLLKERYFSWTALFNELEQFLPMGVQIKNITPSAGDDTVFIRLDCVAKTPLDVVDFIQNLEDSGSFYEVFPTHEKEEFNETHMAGIGFNLVMKYLPLDNIVDGEKIEQESYLRKAN